MRNNTAAPAITDDDEPLAVAAAVFCHDDETCSFNGVCNDDCTACLCDVGWKGRYCHELDLLPARNGSGLSHLLHNDGNRISSWGGSCIYYDGRYHMFYSEILHHCGIHRWVSNSVVSHAVSDGPTANWKFEKTRQLFGLFTHEPIVAIDTTLEEIVLFITHVDPPASDDPICFCKDGNSYSSNDKRCSNEVGFGTNVTPSSYYTYTKAKDLHPSGGKWSKLISLQSVPPDDLKTDLNLAPIIFSNHSLLAWTRWDIWSAKDWRNVSSYKDEGQAPNWTDPNGVWEGEDPSMWIDRRGRYHILSHNGKRGSGGTSNFPNGDCGRHLFSKSGRAGTWIAAPIKFGGCAYPRVNVTFENGMNYSFYRRERPHLILGPDGFTPVALSTSVIDSPIGPSMDDFVPPQRDASYTLVQPIRTAEDFKVQ